jgi:hypothetical protein
VTDDFQALDEFLEDVFLGQDRMTNIEIQRSALSVELPAGLMTRIDALPEGMYSQDEASEALRLLTT